MLNIIGVKRPNKVSNQEQTSKGQVRSSSYVNGRGTYITI